MTTIDVALNLTLINLTQNIAHTRWLHKQNLSPERDKLLQELRVTFIQQISDLNLLYALIGIRETIDEN